jgi:hypothetical protein
MAADDGVRLVRALALNRDRFSRYTGSEMPVNSVNGDIVDANADCVDGHPDDLSLGTAT